MIPNSNWTQCTRWRTSTSLEINRLIEKVTCHMSHRCDHHILNWKFFEDSPTVYGTFTSNHPNFVRLKAVHPVLRRKPTIQTNSTFTSSLNLPPILQSLIKRLSFPISSILIVDVTQREMRKRWRPRICLKCFMYAPMQIHYLRCWLDGDVDRSEIMRSNLHRR